MHIPRLRNVFLIATACVWMHAEAGGYYDLEYDLEARIVVETKDCSGASGVVAFHPARFFKIQPGGCADPEAPDRELKQVLLRSHGRHGSYDVVIVDEQAAQTILRQLQENRQIALQRRY